MSWRNFDFLFVVGFLRVRGRQLRAHGTHRPGAGQGLPSVPFGYRGVIQDVVRWGDGKVARSGRCWRIASAVAWDKERCNGREVMREGMTASGGWMAGDEPK